MAPFGVSHMEYIIVRLNTHQRSNDTDQAYYMSIHIYG